MAKEYIEREAALEIAMQYCPDDDGSCSKAGLDLREMLDEIEAVPAADVVPARHGRWINADDGASTVRIDEDGCPVYSCCCSECNDWLTGSDEYAVRGRYCPNCGARMDGDGE